MTPPSSSSSSSPSGDAAREVIRWPERYRPDRTAVHVRNELEMQARRQVVWAWLVRADLWPTWYANSADVIIEDRGTGELGLGSRFRWKTFGVVLESKVEDFVQYEHLAWSAHALGIDAYHAWLVEDRPYGCHVQTEENQNGWLARLSNGLRPRNMRRYHQLWLEGLLNVAKTGPPPPPTSTT